ncbi:MAG: tetratricopeptide repeat protein [Candidatus Aminicenantes bacterium]|nr:tetratricopeptide repeat protein [Candidatus Aminicenantes bacterium]
MKDKGIFGAAVLICLSSFLTASTAWSGQDLPTTGEYETISLLGQKLSAAAPDSVAVELYRRAKAEFDRNPNETNTIWLGRRVAYLGLYREAVKIFTDGLERFPSSFRLLRHRGHRFITLRQFDKAIADLSKAAELSVAAPLDSEPDGIPNRAKRPLSNTQFNIWYHLGLAHYLKADFAAAAEAYKECLKWSKNDDLLTAATDWLYMGLRRMGKADEAQICLKPIRKKMNIIENGAYHQRLLVYKGLKKPESRMETPAGLSEQDRSLNLAVQAYGLGNWYLYNGDDARARELFEKLVKEGGWAAFGTIAAEAEIFRIVRAPLTGGGPDPDTANVNRLLRAWNAMWNAYDLAPVDKLFLNDDRLSYFSSEKKGLIQGMAALKVHHRGFGFVPGGKSQESRLWLEDVRVVDLGSGQAFLVTATWGFDRDQGPETAQRGPVTFAIVKTESGFRIAHAHFANNPKG